MDAAPDLISEGPIGLSAAARALPAIDGKRPSPSTVWRWARIGVRGVFLEYAKLGGRIVTSMPALSRFAKALAATDHYKPSTWKPSTTITNPRAVQEAEATLAAAGI